jgi:hypothetical protein
LLSCRLQSGRGVGVNGTGSNAYAGTHAPEIVGRIHTVLVQFRAQRNF